MARTVLSVSLASFSTESEAPAAGAPPDVLALDVPAVLGERWLILGSVNKRSNQYSAATVWRIDESRPADPEGDLTLAQCYERTGSADAPAWRPQTMAAVWQPGAAGTAALRLRAFTLLDGFGLELRDLWLIAIKLTALDLVTVSPGPQSNAATTMKRRAALTIPAGLNRTFLAVYYLGYGNDGSTFPSAQIQAIRKGAETLTLNPANANYKGYRMNSPMVAFRRLVAAPGDVQALDFASTGGGQQVQTHDALVALLDVGSFESMQYREDLVDSFRTAVGWQTKGELAFTGIPVRHLALLSAVAAPRASTATGGDQSTRMTYDGAQMEPPSGQNARTGTGPLQSDYPVTRALVLTPASGARKLAWQFSGATAGLTPHLRSSGIFLLQIEPTANVNRVSVKDALIFKDSVNPRVLEGGKARSVRDFTGFLESPSKAMEIWRRN